MPTTINGAEVKAVLDKARQAIPLNGLTPSPADWRDGWIYFLMVDRFNNPNAAPASAFDQPFSGFQGGTIEGVRLKLAYLKSLGVGAIWLTPLLKNCQFLDGAPAAGTYHGYGIQDFLEIDPRFVSDKANPDAELRHFVDDAHATGIYVIFDIVLNHTGDVFAYSSGSQAPFRNAPYDPIEWRDEQGKARTDWPVAEAIVNPPVDATVFPDELRRNTFFRRQGCMPDSSNVVGDFYALKQMLTANADLGNVLIRCFQYLIAAFDIDGFRIDTLKYLDHDFALRFGNAIREFALSVGKKNFFTYGEIWGSEQQISEYIGRNVSAAGAGDVVGVDAALDYPLFYHLPSVLKGSAAPTEVVDMYQYRKMIEQDVVSSHGDATRFFVTFLDNHDQDARFRFVDPAQPNHFDAQTTMGVACLLALPGIPCVYYGTEQGLSGAGGNEHVREALWGKPQAFDTTNPFFACIQRAGQVRNGHAALRYGRFYFRPISGDGSEFSISPFSPGVLSFSRVLNDEEVVVVVNANTQQGFEGFVIVDSSLNAQGATLRVLFSNQDGAPAQVTATTTGATIIHEVDGSLSNGPARVIRVSVRPMEILIFGSQ